MQDEKRKYPRTEVGWPVTMMTTEDNIESPSRLDIAPTKRRIFDGKIENVSADGAYIRCEIQLFRNALFLVGILGVDQKPMWMGAEVVRTDVTFTPNLRPAQVGMGVRFTSISAEDRQLLTNVVSEHIKLGSRKDSQKASSLHGQARGLGVSCLLKFVAKT
jgi:hypothetical protein